ncbi:MAG: DNA polymerase I [Patescibacteria group bacterium]|jgi:DNA polymerase-1
MPTKTKFVIIDSNALIHRAFHALPPLTTKDGRLVNAAYGFTSVLLKVIKEFKPQFIAAAFDVAKKTFRHEEYAEYKATRVKAPQELYDQIPIVKEVLRTLNIKIYELPGYEADDVIGTLTIRQEVDQPNVESIIVTGDMDELQLVDGNTKVYRLQKGMSDTLLYDADTVRKKFDITPAQVPDYKALAGDASDNIPGVKGVGQVTAINLLKQFDTVEDLYSALKKNEKLIEAKPRIIDLLKKYESDAFLSKKLATIVCDIPIDFKLADCRHGMYDRMAAIKLFQELEFKSLLARLPEMQTQGSLLSDSAPRTAEPVRLSKNYHLIQSVKDLKPILNQAKQSKLVAVDTETNGLDPLTADLLGVSLSWQNGVAYYINVQPGTAERDKLLDDLKIFLEDSSIEKAGHNMKFDIMVLARAGIELTNPGFDTMIASYLIDPSSRQHGLDAVVFSELGHEMIPIEQLIGKGKMQKPMENVPLEELANYSCEDADYTLRLVAPLRQKLRKAVLENLFLEIEMPLVPVLAKIETLGVLIDTKFLNQMSDQLTKQIAVLEKRIHKAAGEEFNINSPLQLKRIFFDKLDLDTEGIGSTKTGYSTAASELDKLHDAHPIVPMIIEYRELAKLISTYIDALPELINPQTGRVHTSFNQAVTSTGRLSSSNPNLQNIPIRTELGKQIRKAFIASPGSVIVSADYSQIELRIAAAIAYDRSMLEAFRNNEDIHTRTAAEINGVQPEDVTPEMRRAAKAINFGILYGMGVYGLARGTNLDVDEASDYIETYFEHHQGIKEYIEETKALARRLGYVETLFGRRRYLPEIQSSNRQIRTGAERMAINMPIQGTAADLLKMAMIKIHRELPAISPKTKMILQVHDELVFEVPQDETKKVARYIQDAMENIYTLKVPIKVEIDAGPNWGELSEVK